MGVLVGEGQASWRVRISAVLRVTRQKGRHDQGLRQRETKQDKSQKRELSLRKASSSNTAEGLVSGQPFWTSSGLLFSVTHRVRGRHPSVVFTSCLINFSVPSSFAIEKETRLVLLKQRKKPKLKSFSFRIECSHLMQRKVDLCASLPLTAPHPNPQHLNKNNYSWNLRCLQKNSIRKHNP